MNAPPSVPVPKPVAPGSGTPAATPQPPGPPARPPHDVPLGELRGALEALLALPDATRVYFGDGQLGFNRIVQQPGGAAQIEFNEVYAVTPDPTGG